MDRTLKSRAVVLSVTAALLSPGLASHALARTSGDEGREVFSVDAVHSSVVFRVTHMGVGPFLGKFDAVRGRMELSRSESPIALDLEVPIESVNTGSKKLNGVLRSADFFDAAKFPAATFQSRSSVRRDDGTYKITGDLTIHGVTREVEVTARGSGPADTQMGRRAGLETEFVIKRSDFGMTYGIQGGMVGDEIRLIVGLEGVNQKGGGRTGRRAGGRNPSRMLARLKALDANKDGKIARDEVPERMMRIFKRVDENEDGVIDARELEAYGKRTRRRSD